MLSVGYCINSKVVNSFDQYLPVFSSICRYLPVNTAGMENTHICQPGVDYSFFRCICIFELFFVVVFFCFFFFFFCFVLFF